MSSVTGIELGPDYCVVVKARVRADIIEIGAARVFEPGEWPSEAAARAALLAQARRDLGLPWRAWLVHWNIGSPGAAPAAAPDARTEAEHLLRDVGFQAETVLSAPHALALLAGSRGPLPGAAEAALWLSINHQGAALAIVRGFETLYSREFAWRITAPEQRVQAHLLRRYLMVAQLTPEIRRAVGTVRAQHGIVIDYAMTCGTTPDLRSLTMPLIEELDIEFETLDSPAGIDATAETAPVVAQFAPALRLAWVTAAAAAAQGRDVGVGRWLGAAAVTALAVSATLWAFASWTDATRSVRTMPPQSPIPIAGPPSDRESPPEVPAGMNRPIPPRSSPVSDASRAGTPATPRPTTGVDKPQAARGHALQTPEPPFPDVSGILISADRRFAVIDGVVVSQGDRVGARVVMRIEPDAVVLREPSGREIRVRVRSRGGL